MYAGRIVEFAPVESIFNEQFHPYTQLLIESIPSIKEKKPLKLTEGLTHDLRTHMQGCIFQLRCPHVMDICREENPPMRPLRSRPRNRLSPVRRQRRSPPLGPNALRPAYPRPNTKPRDTSAMAPLLDIKKATKIYGGGMLSAGPVTVALQDYDLTIEESPATITTIAGESGSGKSTLANLVLGFTDLTSGQIIYRGRDLRK